MKILILGRNGQVATELAKACSQLGEVVTLGSEQASFLSPDVVLKYIEDIRPTHIINAAAYTAVDRAEIEEAEAQQINGTTVGLIAKVAQKINAILVHYSTDYVFDGAKSSPFIESDETRPLNAYGRSKLLGEDLIQQAGGGYVILRISWVYGQTGNNFYRTMLRLGYERAELEVVDDQIGAPTWSRDVAAATVQILKDADLKSKSGIYHLSPQGQTSWCGFARKIFELQRKVHPDQPLKVQQVFAIPSAEYPTPAQRPRNSRLSADKIEKTFGVRLPPWEQSLEKMMKESP